MMAWASLELYQTTFDPRWFAEARGLGDEMLRSFHDERGGGFFQTAADAEGLITRPKELFDNAVPSGNSVAADVLLRLGLLTGEPEYERAGVSALRVARDLMPRAPSAFGHAFGALDLYLSAAKEVAIVGEPGPARDALVGEVWRRFMPNAVLAVATPGDAEAVAAVPLLAGRVPIGGQPAAYVCQGFVCRMPITTPEDLAAQLDAP